MLVGSESFEALLAYTVAAVGETVETDAGHGGRMGHPDPHQVGPQILEPELHLWCGQAGNREFAVSQFGQPGMPFAIAEVAKVGQAVQRRCIGLPVRWQVGEAPAITLARCQPGIEPRRQVDRLPGLWNHAIGHRAQCLQLLLREQGWRISGIVGDGPAGQRGAHPAADSRRGDQAGEGLRDGRSDAGLTGPERRDVRGHLDRPFKRQQVTGTLLDHDGRAWIDQRIGLALSGFAQVAIGPADDDQCRQVQRSDLSAPVLAAAAFQPCQPGLRGGLLQILKGQAVGLRIERATGIAVHECPRSGLVQRALGGPGDHLPAPVFFHRFRRRRGGRQQHHTGQPEQARLARQGPGSDDRGDLAAHAVADQQPSGGAALAHHGRDMIGHADDTGFGCVALLAEAGEVDGNGFEAGVE